MNTAADDVGSERVAGESPEVVLTFGGHGGRVYHRVRETLKGDLVAWCSQQGRNPLLKERAAIESHYSPCRRCFADGLDGADE
jgi:hypothetical protein